MIADYGIILEIIGFILILLHQMFTYGMKDSRRAKFSILIFIGMFAVIAGLIFQFSFWD